MNYTNTSTNIYFKSNKANGYAFLSSFWPDVDEKAQLTVYELFHLDNPTSQATAALGFVVDTIEYPTREHYYQSQKWLRYPLISRDILAQPTAVDAKKRNTYWKNQRLKPTKYTSSREFQMIDLRYSEPAQFTDDALIEIMYHGAYEQFTQNVLLMSLLLSTEGKHLSEVPGRTGGGLWAGGPKGQDTLGRILDHVRDQLLLENVA